MAGATNAPLHTDEGERKHTAQAGTRTRPREVGDERDGTMTTSADESQQY